MIRVSSAVSGEEIAAFDAADFEGKSAKDLKQRLSTLIQCSRYRQKLYTEDQQELADDEPMAAMAPMTLRLVMLEFWPSDSEQAKELSLACEENQVDVLEALLKRPLNPDLIDSKSGSKNWTALHAAAMHRREDCARLLLEAGANCDPVDDDEATPLHAAAWMGSVEIVEQLLSAGAQKDRRTADAAQATPLLLAAENGFAEVVELLLEQGAQKDVATSDTGETALHLAASNGDQALAELLLQFGADQSKVTKNGATALHAAAWEDCSSIVELLLENGSEPDAATTDNGETPLHYAARRGFEYIAQQLTEAGADLNKQTRDNGATPLHSAVWNRQGPVVELLLQNGADTSKTMGETGETPLQLAKRLAYDDIALLFQSSQVSARPKKRKWSSRSARPARSRRGKKLQQLLVPVDLSQHHFLIWGAGAMLQHEKEV